ncbi:Rho GTPase-activating protein 42 [Takifugu flavidus]|uniref:Rho GTPase-activating protein 42 n=1 Tax=Takifugu flavidus TaxID=433684 RepID=A0A5C6PE48_9TELE|nr:Rho GTPase-activating protein 42 [Takifugu flavidus]
MAEGLAQKRWAPFEEIQNADDVLITPLEKFRKEQIGAAKNPCVNPLVQLDRVTKTVVKPVDLSWARGLNHRQRSLAENEEGAPSCVEVERRGRDVPEECW